MTHPCVQPLEEEAAAYLDRYELILEVPSPKLTATSSTPAVGALVHCDAAAVGTSRANGAKEYSPSDPNRCHLILKGAVSELTIVSPSPTHRRPIGSESA
jgi:hypothetical protein